MCEGERERGEFNLSQSKMAPKTLFDVHFLPILCQFSASVIITCLIRALLLLVNLLTNRPQVNIETRLGERSLLMLHTPTATCCLFTLSFLSPFGDSGLRELNVGGGGVASVETHASTVIDRMSAISETGIECRLG